MSNDPYELVDYPALAQRQAMPDRLATVATLLGLSPAPPAQCRMLELGCGDGATLLAAAATADPAQSHFVGIDLAERPIARGKRLIEQLGWRHVELHRMNVMDAPSDLGTFDYIVAHGLYSWVPQPVRDRILEIASRNLAPQGVAYVSYNAYPGWHVRGMIRQIMLHHTRDLRDPLQRVRRGIELVERIADSLPAADQPMAAVFRRESQRLSKALPEQIYHDDFAPINQPFWLHEFLDCAAARGLKYLGEAQFDSLNIAEADADTPVEEREQHADYVRFRHFRQTLLCHAGVEIRRPVPAEAIRSMWIASPARAARPDTDQVADVAEFTSPRGAAVSTNHPLAKAALALLSEAWPGAVSFADLNRAALARTGGGPSATGELEQPLLSLLTARRGGGMLELHVRPPPFALEPGVRPLANPLARAQVQDSQDSASVTALNGATVRVEGELARTLLRLLDGTRDRPAILEQLAAIVPPGPSREALNAQLDDKLRALARLGLLIS